MCKLLKILLCWWRRRLMLLVGSFLYFYNPPTTRLQFFLLLFTPLPTSYQTSHPPATLVSGFGRGSYRLHQLCLPNRTGIGDAPAARGPP